MPHPPFGDPERYPFVAQSIDKALADLVADDPLRVDVGHLDTTSAHASTKLTAGSPPGSAG
jgi:hypothetical protein